jgi:hypothetical protein
MYQLNIDTKEITKLTENLRQLHKSAFPVAVRQVLNDLSFDVKQMQLLPMANSTFTVRNKTLFSKYSKVTKAGGLNVSGMVAQAGMIDDGPGQTFDEQEKGGSYKHKDIPMTSARIGNSNKGKVSRTNYIDNGKIDRSMSSRTRSKKSQAIADFAMGFKLKKLVNYNGTLFRVIRFKRTNSGLKIGLKQIYTEKDGQNVDVKPTFFIQKSALKSMEKTTRFYKRAANQRFKKYFK